MATRRRRKRIKAAEHNGEKPAENRGDPHCLYRLRVVGEADPDGGYPLSRDVFLECVDRKAFAADPMAYESGERAWGRVLYEFSLPIHKVQDLIRFAKRHLDVSVVYDPPDNMRGWINRERPEQLVLFDMS